MNKKEEKYTNEYEFGTFGPWRSGHHAIVLWMAQSISANKDVWLFPNVEHYEDPLQYCRNHADMLRKYDCCKIYDIHDLRNNPSKYRKIPKKCVIYDFENVMSFRKFSQSKFYNERQKYLGKSKKYKNIIILRDPFNNLASLLKADFPRSKFTTIWKAHAKEYLGLTNFVSNKVVISYNTWFTSEGYRKRIASRIGIPFTDANLEVVSPWGWASSFDSTKYDGKAQKMDTLNRWKNFEGNEYFKRILKDDELWDLSEKIFGKIKGTERLR